MIKDKLQFKYVTVDC